MHVLHVIPALTVGGAEQQLVLLARGLRAAGAEVTIVSLRPRAALSADAEAVAQVVHLNVESARALPASMRAVAGLLQNGRPALVQGWLAAGNVAAAGLGQLLRRPVVFGLRHTELPAGVFAARSRAIGRLERVLARRVPVHIIASSVRAEALYAARGYPNARMSVIDNGIDTARFAQVALPAADRICVGQLARVHPMKGHAVLLSALALLAPAARAQLAVQIGGPGVSILGATVAAELRAGLRFVDAPRVDPVAFFTELDVLVSPSIAAESFPNVVAEAMAMGRPALVTDVGDSARIVGDTGWVVPAGDAAALARALADVAATSAAERAARGTAAAQRVHTLFGAERNVAAHLALYARLLA